MNVRFSELALAELDAILATMRKDNPAGARRFAERMQRVIERIALFPEGAEEIKERPVHPTGAAQTLSLRD
jgi:plasmid stabilization system protein ParE